MTEKTAKKTAEKRRAKSKTAKKTSAKTAIKKKPAAKKSAAKTKAASAAAPVKPKAPIRQRARFRLNEHVVYPAHGVGQIVEIKEQAVDGQTLEFFVIDFKQERMVLRVPVNKIAAIGMRKLADEKSMLAAFAVLKQPPRIKRTMWSRRAQEYEAKINSGDLILLCEVVRDLYRSDDQREQSYSERQLYEAAFGRLLREVVAARKLNDEVATEILLAQLGGGRAEDLSASTVLSP